MKIKSIYERKSKNGNYPKIGDIFIYEAKHTPKQLFKGTIKDIKNYIIFGDNNIAYSSCEIETYDPIDYRDNKLNIILDLDITK